MKATLTGFTVGLCLMTLVALTVGHRVWTMSLAFVVMVAAVACGVLDRRGGDR